MIAVTQPVESCLCLGGLCPHPCNLLSGCGKQKNHGEGKGVEVFPPTAKTKFESLESSAYPLSPPPGSSPDPSSHLTMKSQHLGHICPGAMELSQYWKGAPHAPSVSISTCLALPQITQCGHRLIDSQLQGCFLAWMWSQGHFFLLAISCKMFSIEPRSGALGPS